MEGGDGVVAARVEKAGGSEGRGVAGDDDCVGSEDFNNVKWIVAGLSGNQEIVGTNRSVFCVWAGSD